MFLGGSRAQRQATYTLVHPSLGTFQLLLVPSGADQNGAQGYVATINRLSLADAARYLPPSAGTRFQPSGTTTAPAPQPSNPPATQTPAPNTSPNSTPAAQPAAPPVRPPAKKPSRKRRTS